MLVEGKLLEREVIRTKKSEEARGIGNRLKRVGHQREKWSACSTEGREKRPNGTGVPREEKMDEGRERNTGSRV